MDDKNMGLNILLKWCISMKTFFSVEAYSCQCTGERLVWWITTRRKQTALVKTGPLHPLWRNIKIESFLANILMLLETSSELISKEVWRSQTITPKASNAYFKVLFNCTITWRMILNKQLGDKRKPSSSSILTLLYIMAWFSSTKQYHKMMSNKYVDFVYTRLLKSKCKGANQKKDAGNKKCAATCSINS